MDIGRIGLWTRSSIWDGDDEEHREAAAELDELGYGALWLGGANGDLRLVSRLLAGTGRIVVATGIINIWTHDPAPLAATAHQVARAHPGRLLIGLGSSHAPLVDGTGQRYVKPY